jgi:peptide/nickel transport system substrate-binding protein
MELRRQGLAIGRSSGPRRIAAVLATFAIVMAACSPATPSGSTAGSAPPAEGTAGASAPPAGGDVTVTAALPGLSSMDWAPATSSGDEEKLLIMVGDNLTQLNRETRQVEGALAESWEISPDGLTWTWKLRPNVQFHDGWGTVTAEDVKFSWWEWAREESTHTARPQMAQAIDGNIDNFEIVDDLTFKLHTTQPIVHLPAVVCSCWPGMTVTSKKYFDETPVEEANKHPIGTGPFKFVSSTPGVEIRLDANKDYWGTVPAFDHLVMQEIPDGAARLVQVQSGAVDIAQLDAELSGEATAAGLQISTIPDFGNAFLLLGGSYYGDDEHLDKDSPWIQADAPEKGLLVREAMSLAIDRQLIIDQVLNGEATPAYGPLIQYPNEDLIDPSWELPAYDLALAKQKLAEGGYPDGFPVKMPIFADDINTDSIGEAIAGMWEELGLQVTREPTEKDLIDPLQENRTTDGLAYVLIAGFTAEPAMALSNYVSFRSDDAKLFHEAIDDGYNRISVEPDQAKRFAIAREVLTALRDDVQPITLFTVNMPFVLGSRVASWDPIAGLNSINSLETITLK